MNKARRTVEQIKESFRRQILSDAITFKRSIIRQIEVDYRQLKAVNPDLTRQALQDVVLQELKVKPSFVTDIQSEIAATDKEITYVWKQYFNSITRKEFIPADYEKILSLSKVNFNKLDVTLSRSVTNELIKQKAGDTFDFERFISALKKKDIGDAEAYTLANTSVAQFDNSYHSETAQQAGIEKFLIDGLPPGENSHQWCHEHVGNVYTIAELEQMDNGSGLPVVWSLGGYNCVHYPTAQIE
jgi:hypothetical protein